jgi:hypothetical protein
MNQSNFPPNGSSFIDPLVKALLAVFNRLTDPIPLFLLAIAIIILIAAAVGGEGLVVELRVFFAFLAVLGVSALVFSQILSHSKDDNEGDRKMMSSNQEKYRTLREWLDILNPRQFQAMQANLLTPSEQDELSHPISKSTFLNDMHRWGRLKEVGDYMQEKFPGQFSEEIGDE